MPGSKVAWPVRPKACSHPRPNPGTGRCGCINHARGTGTCSRGARVMHAAMLPPSTVAGGSNIGRRDGACKWRRPVSVAPHTQTATRPCLYATARLYNLRSKFHCFNCPAPVKPAGTSQKRRVSNSQRHTCVHPAQMVVRQPGRSLSTPNTTIRQTVRTSIALHLYRMDKITQFIPNQQPLSMAQEPLLAGQQGKRQKY